MTHLWIDATAGVAGDMLLGALHDAGASLDRIQSAVDAVLPGAVRITAVEVQRAGLRARKVEVTAIAADQPHRTWRDIRDLLGSAPRAAEVFARLAAAESAVHGVSPEDIHFHEVGALDAIADVVGVCAALDDLGITTVSASEVAVGSGTVRAAHGVLPVPAPAVAELARGWRIRAGGTGELATPTGLALLRTLATTCEDLPSMTLSAVGIGAGTRDTPQRPNIVRALIGDLTPPSRENPHANHLRPSEPAHTHPASGKESPRPTSDGNHHHPAPDEKHHQAALDGEHRRPASDGEHRRMGPDGERADPTRTDEVEQGRPAVILEANIDDLDPRLWPGVISALLEAGADDAWLVPILMKKGRPANTLTVLCAPAAANALRDRIFQETSTLGVRTSPRTKTALERTFAHLEVDGHPVAIKLGHAAGQIVQAMPEFEDIAALARALGITQREALARATQAAANAGLVIGAPQG